ncbi:hypothetical protein [Staphylococcus sp. GDX8P47P]|uniref:hypothetical protein n=1 Tax=Staphylococcus sp. GDX8P47P TaxID=2804098 RepID=UPI001AEC6BF1|nr:hypothetical protein [Staphylococcus sp. GDX8P47P]
MTNKLIECGNIQVSKAKKDNLLVVSCNGALAGTGRTESNLYVDEERAIIHLFDDLRHTSTSIMSVVNTQFVIELTSLLGIEYNKYRVIVYYAPIKHNPFIVEFLKDENEFIEVRESDIFDKFYQMAMNNEKIIKR